MDKRKEKISSHKVCRFCLTESDPLENLYDRIQTSKDSVNLHLKILTCVSVEVFPSDKMPCYICNRCNSLMNLFYDYKHIVRQADENILHYIQTGTPLEPIKWSSSLLKATKASKEVIMKTVVEGGATVQVSSQDVSDSEEEEDANIYNVKIGDGTDGEEKTACIKVVSAKPSQDMEVSGQNKGTKSEKSQSRLEGCWACDECDCTYPLQQLLDLHKSQKHRARNVQCDKCDAKFFNKYDLSTHLLRHSDEMPFQCVACGKRFKRNILLKRHEKFIHSDLPQHTCPNCPATFLSLEQFKAHEKKHIRVPRPYSCSQCDKTFNERALLQRHKDAVHNKTLSFHCEYCPERFSSVSKLTRHVRSHAGIRPYPCKFCDKSFTKSHHYTRHLRVRHRNETRTSRDEQYRCEQCDINFNTQDELIYHSAIHATQSLTCPLCQEKFDDVDAVTTHIKSHVTGDEFMCDFCELVFTAREKLDSHMMAAHEEEMQQDTQEESEEMEAEDEDEDNSINVKEVDENNMVIEIKKPDEFMIKGTNEIKKEKVENTNSEESEAEALSSETPATTTVIKKPPITILSEQTIYKPAELVTIEKNEAPKESPKPPPKKSNTQLLDIVWSEEEPKTKADQQTEAAPVKIEKPSVKVESSTGVGDKSLRLLEKELQDLKRTNSSKVSVKSTDANLKSRRPLHTSTPKLKSSEEKKPMKPVIPKKVPTKENKEPKEVKEPKEIKEPKEVKEKEPKINGNDKEEKEKDSKSVLKNGGSSSDKSTDEGIRRSTRPSKIKNYAKMVRDKPQAESNDDTEDDDDEEYKEVETRPRGRRSSLKQSPKPTVAATPPAATPARKRGRPRKDANAHVPAKIKKETEESDEEAKETTETATSSKLKDILERNKSSNTSPEVKSPPVLVYPSGQTLKKVHMKALPPGVRPLPLPANARPVTTGDLCEMQIGKKVVKVQKIVMTRAEVEAMAKKGLVEMKDGTMVLKQGIKLPTSDPANLKSTLVGETTEASKEPAPKKEIPKGAPTRCDLEEV